MCASFDVSASASFQNVQHIVFIIYVMHYVFVYSCPGFFFALHLHVAPLLFPRSGSIASRGPVLNVRHRRWLGFQSVLDKVLGAFVIMPQRLKLTSVPKNQR